MIPVLYYAEETSFTSNGIGRLADIISCLVTEERNGIYEVEFQYPITGVHYSDIQEGRIISVTHDEQKDRQPFRIYRRSAPIDGIVTFNAHHLAYDLQNVILEPYTAGSAAAALAGFTTHNLTNCPFTFWTDKVVSATFKNEVPSTIWDKLGGSEGSILDVYGTGEWEFDKFTAKLYLHRGSDNGVTIRYGKNLLDLENTVEDDGTYNAIIPYWRDENGNTVYGSIYIGNGVPLSTAVWTEENDVPINDENGVDIEFTYLNLKCVPYDFTDRFSTQPTAAQLNSYAQTFLNNNQPWIPKQNLTVDFAALWQTEEYENYANLQRVKLCDTVSVIYSALGVNVKAQVIRVVWNALLDRYDEIELGDAKASYASLVAQEANIDTEAMIAEQASITASAIQEATERITGGLGGHVLFKYDANGKPTDILIMDTEDESTAVHILRINVNGIGFSSNGGSTYSTAWTLNGAFVADYITSGTLTANLIKAGTIQGTGDSNYWDLVNGVFSAQAGYIGGFSIVSNNLNYNDGTYQYFMGTSNGFISGLYHPTAATPYWEYGRLYRGTLQFYTDLNAYVAKISGLQGGLYIDGISASLDIGSGNTGISSYGKINLWGINQIYIDVEPSSYTGSYARCYFNSNGSLVWSYTGNFVCGGNFTVSGGTKSRSIQTKDYSERKLYCLETPSPMFSDVGEGEIGDDGKAYIWVDPIFAETIQKTQYQVFLQEYGYGECFVSERHEAFFIVEGTAGLKFGWEIKAKQIDYTNLRLERVDDPADMNQPDYACMAVEHIDEIYKERGLKE